MISKTFISFMISMSIVVAFLGFAYMFFMEPNMFKHQIYPEMMGINEHQELLEESIGITNVRIDRLEDQIDLMRTMINQNSSCILYKIPSVQ